ncbi:MAG: vWA domain-containing protein [Prevotella sp.]
MKKSFYSIGANGAKCIGLFLCAALSFTSCSSDDEDPVEQEEEKVLIAGIPSDDDATPNPVIDEQTTTIPNVMCTTEREGDDLIVRLDMTGVQDANGIDWLRLRGTGYGDEQNVWLEVEGKPKGILVYNTADDQSADAQVKADLVFLIDNSGSMSEEADAIARDIISWAQKLSESGLDMRYGCVGYDGRITGALNITDATSLAEFLNYSSGTNRTYHFGGPDASVLRNAASAYDNSYNECGVAALRFADEQFAFREGANRIYVNFTDEPNQPNGKEDFSVEYVNKQDVWNTSKGTVHTVYSDSYTSYSESALYREYPWRLSEYTGGTFLTAPYDFSGVSLESLPVTGAMTNSYIIRFTNVAELFDGKAHEVKITILSKDGTTKAEKVFSIVFG